MARRKTKPKSRSGLFFMIIILILLGVIIFAYKEKFQVAFKSGFNSSKEFVEKKLNLNNDKKNKVSKKIEKIENKINKNINEKQKKDNTSFEKKNTKNNDVKNTIKEKIIRGEIPIEIDKNVVTKFKKENKIEKVSPDNEYKKNIENKIEKAKTKEVDLKKTVEKKNIEELKKSNIIYNKKSTVYFTKINDERLSLTSVQREIDYYNTPLTETIKKLLDGPNYNEKSENIVSNIPSNTKLLSVWIKDNIAYLNFSHDFEKNFYGRESTVLQLKQVVFTVTEFNNIKSVQILIDGKKQTYLGGEGVVIGKPLSRNDFS